MSNDIDRRKEMVAAAAVAMARSNVAKAAAMFGQKLPAAPAAPTPAPTPVASEAPDWLVREYEHHRTEARAAEAKASWSKVIAKFNGEPARNDTVSDPTNPWSRVVAAMNARNGKSPAETRATRSGWAAVIADFNARRGR